jgi:hypothetical protein
MGPRVSVASATSLCSSFTFDFVFLSVSVPLILRFFARRKDFSCRFPLQFIDLVKLTAES